MYRLEGKVALVTGAGGRAGIGRATAMRLAREGADVIVSDIDRGAEAFRAEDVEAGWRGIESVADEIRALGRRSIAMHADVTKSAEVDALFARTAELGALDIFVSNAATSPGADRRPIVDVPEEAFDTILRVNVKGAFLCCRAASRLLVTNRTEGRILLMSSILGKRGRELYASYCASKFALVGLMESLALELAPHRITVNAVCPGPVDTERFDHVAKMIMPTGSSYSDVRKEMMAQRAKEIPLGRVPHADEVANTVAFLASSEASFLTGLSVEVAGGFGMK